MQSRRRYLIFFIVALAIAGGFTAYKFWGERYRLVLTEEQLAAQLNEKFPFDKAYFFVINLHFANPKLALEDGSDRISFGCEVETNIKLELNSEKRSRPLPGSLHGAAKLSGKIRYEPDNGAFFLDEPKVESLDIAGVPEKWRRRVSEAVARATGEFLSRAPVYKLRPTDMKKAAARLILRDVKVLDKKLILTMGVG